MREELELYLSYITTPENISVIKEANEVLLNAEVFSQEIAIEDFISTIENYNHEDNLLFIFKLFKDQYADILSEFGVFYRDSVSLSLLTKTLETLLIIPSYGDNSELVRIMSLETNNGEKFCSILEAITLIPCNLFLEHLDRVNNSLLEKIATVIDNNLLEEETEVEIKDISVFRSRFVKVGPEINPTLALNCIRNGTKLGTDIDTILTLYTEQIAELEGKPELLVNELIGLVLISNTPDGSVVSVLENIIEKNSRDINITTKANVYLNKLIKKGVL